MGLGFYPSSQETDGFCVAKFSTSISSAGLPFMPVCADSFSWEENRTVQDVRGACCESGLFLPQPSFCGDRKYAIYVVHI